MLQDHDFKHLLGLGVGKLTLGDEGADVGQQGMDALIRELADIGEKCIPKMPEMLLSFNSCVNSIKGHLLVLWGDDPIVNKGLKSLSIFTLEHHLQLTPACEPVICLISVDVKGFQAVKHPCVEDFPVLPLMGGIKGEFGSFPVVNGVTGNSYVGKA